MSRDDTFSSSSGSSERPFHSTPAKTKVEFVSSKILIENGADSDSEVSEQTPESPGGDHTTAFTATKSLTSTPPNSTFERSDSTSRDYDTFRRPAHVTSAWEQWLLKKEKQRRVQLLIQFEQKQKEVEDEKHLLEVKMLQKKVSEERYQKWLFTKKTELQKRLEEDLRLKAKKELETSLVRQKAKLMSEMQLKKWRERKLREKKSSVVQESARSAKEGEEHKQKCDSAFNRWLKDHQNCQRDHYSYGYAGGIIVSYYDATSPPPPTFFNPDPWL